MGVHNNSERGKRTVLLFWLKECDMGHYSLKKEKRHLIQPAVMWLELLRRSGVEGHRSCRLLGATRRMLVSGRWRRTGWAVGGSSKETTKKCFLFFAVPALV